MRFKTGHGAWMAPAVVLLATVACDTAGYGRPIARFQDASSVVIATMRFYLTTLNRVEREAYINQQVAGGEAIRLSEVSRQEVFSQDSIQARLETLQQLANYCSLLGQLATSEAPARVAQEAASLGDAVKALSGTVSSLAKSDDAGFRNAVGPVSKLFGAVAQLALEKKAQAALDEAIRSGAQPVGELVRVWHGDLEIAVARRKQAISALRVYYVDRYNAAQKSGAPKEVLKQRADELKAQLDEYEKFTSSNPGEALDAMAGAHAALLKYAQQKRKSPRTLAELVEAMETFAARAKRVGESVQELRAR